MNSTASHSNKFTNPEKRLGTRISNGWINKTQTQTGIQDDMHQNEKKTIGRG